jgi:hypothetical protein
MSGGTPSFSVQSSSDIHWAPNTTQKEFPESIDVLGYRALFL